ncbi:MAG: hypothetical protein ABI794_08600 [Betaproteobacteria bacterium]
MNIECELDVPDTWFEGHFPGNPILPGVAQLALAVDALSRESDAGLALTGIPFVRLRQLVRPGDRLRLVAEPRSSATWRIAITSAGKTVTNGELRFGPPGTPPPATPDWPTLADAPPVAMLLPHRPPMRFVTHALAESAEGLRGAARIPGNCPLVSHGVAPVLAAIEAAAQISALWEATRRLRAGPGTGPRLGYLVGLREVTLLARHIPADTTFVATATLKALSLPLAHYAIEADLDGACILRGTLSAFLTDSASPL